MDPGADSIEDEMNTESATEEFMGGPMDAKSAEEDNEFSQQVKIYAQNKPRKKKKSTDRKCKRSNG